MLKSNTLFFIAPNENVPVLPPFITKFVPSPFTAPVDSKLNNTASVPVTNAFTVPLTVVAVFPAVYNPRELFPESSRFSPFIVTAESLANIPTPSFPVFIIPLTVKPELLV